MLACHQLNHFDRCQITPLLFGKHTNTGVGFIDVLDQKSWDYVFCKWGMLWMSLKHKPVHIVSDHHAGVVPLDNEVGIEGDREVFVRNLWFQYHSSFTMHPRRGHWNVHDDRVLESFWIIPLGCLWCRSQCRQLSDFRAAIQTWHSLSAHRCSLPKKETFEKRGALNMVQGHTVQVLKPRRSNIMKHDELIKR